MGIGTGCALLALCLAGDPAEGTVAGAAQWGDPEGPPSGSGASAARPLTGDLEEAWSFALPGELLRAPLQWGPSIYLACEGGAQGPILLAVDLALGREVARTRLAPAADAGRIVVWDGTVLVPAGALGLHGYRVAGKGFNRVWIFRPPDRSDLVPMEPLAYRNEVYLVLDGRLLMVRIGSSSPDWQQEGSFRNRPAIRGDRLFVVERGAVAAGIAVLSRRTGDLLGRTEVAPLAGKAADGAPARILAREDSLEIRGPAPFRGEVGAWTDAEVPMRTDPRGGVAFDETRLRNHLCAPVLHAGRLLVQDRVEERVSWMLWSKEGGHRLAAREEQPDFFEDSFPPVVLGGVAYFGRWAADLETREVLWRLPVGRLRYPPTPADRLLVVAPEDRTVRAFRERRMR